MRKTLLRLGLVFKLIGVVSWKMSHYIRLTSYWAVMILALLLRVGPTALKFLSRSSAKSSSFEVKIIFRNCSEEPSGFWENLSAGTLIVATKNMLTLLQLRISSESDRCQWTRRVSPSKQKSPILFWDKFYSDNLQRLYADRTSYYFFGLCSLGKMVGFSQLTKRKWGRDVPVHAPDDLCDRIWYRILRWSWN